MTLALGGKIVQVLLVCALPALIQAGTKRFRELNRLGPVVFCYLSGILLVNVFRYPVDTSLSTTITEIAVALAIPLLLFSSNFLQWLRLAKNTLLSIVLAFGSVIVCAAAGAFIFASRVAEAPKIGGMLVGVYTGGTPNMSAIGLALSVEEETFILLNAVDVVLGTIYLLFLMTVAQRLLGKFLPMSRRKGTGREEEADSGQSHEKSRSRQAIGLGLSLLIVGVSIGISLLAAGKMQVVVVILVITTLGIAFSFVRRIREIPGTYETGEYLLLMFCLAIGTLANIQELIVVSINIFLFVAFVMFGAVLLHYLLSMVFRIDVDTVLITSTAAIFGPAFVGPIANVLKNREVVVSGLAAGLLGYALGNYLGISLALLLK